MHLDIPEGREEGHRWAAAHQGHETSGDKLRVLHFAAFRPAQDSRDARVESRGLHRRRRWLVIMHALR
jgi:hypothetical protein